MNLRQRITESVHSDERAVSPVIGVILMVAITVILAAVIGAFVLGIGDDVQQEVQAGVNVDGEGSDEVTVTWTSEGTATELYFQGDETVVVDGNTKLGFDAVDDEKLTEVGQSQSFDGQAGGTISVVAHNEDDNVNTTIRTIDIAES